MTRYRSPGRKETARLCTGRPYREAVYTMQGNVPQAVEEDKEFWLLFQQSKQLEKALADAHKRKRADIGVIQVLQDDFNACINKIRARWLELVPEDMPGAKTGSTLVDREARHSYG
jgi:hypothetical protein